MIREDKFRISRRPYAVDLSEPDSVEEHRHADDALCYSIRVNAVWFRRRRGVTVACIGSLWDFQDQRPESVEQFLLRHDDGRYGGTTVGRWDGESYWGSGVTLEVQNRHLEILVPMLENFPETPRGYDGWWRFETDKERFGDRA